MSAKWEAFFDQVRDDSKRMAGEELKDLLGWAKDDSDLFVRIQGEKLERYLNQFAAGEITRGQFEGYVLDIRDLAEMQQLKMTVAGKASAQRLAEGITEVIVKGFLRVV